MLRFGLIGAGAIAHAFSTACQGTGVTLQAVASRSIEKAREFQKKYGFIQAYGDYLSLYQDPLVDAIYVATPHGLHYEQMKEIIQHKKHILCEKAFTLNRQQASHIFELAKAQGVFVMEAMWTRFLPVTQTVLNRIQNGMIGEIQSMKVDFAFGGNPSDDARLMNPALGGGALLDVGIYPITYANLVLGVPNTLEAKARLTHTKVDGTVDLIYHYNHAVATLHASVIEEGGKDAWIYGSKGSIKVPFFWGAHEAYIYDLSKEIIEHIEIPHKVNGYEYEIHGFIEAVENHSYRTHWMNVENTLEILRQMDEIRKQIGVAYPNETVL